MVDYNYLRPKKAEALRKWHESEFKEKSDIKCRIFSNAVVLPVKRIENETLQFGHGGVIADGKYVESSGIEGRVGGYYSFDRAEKSDLTVVYCGFFLNQWGHFLLESVARLWYCLDAPSDVDKYIFVSKSNVSSQLTGNYKEFFELLGILDKVEIIDHPVEYKKVYVPELGFSRKYYYNDGYRRVFSRIVDNALKRCSLSDRADRVFLSRGRFAKAKGAEAGLEMLDNYFENNGYRILYPELLSLTDMIYYLQNADICAAESGTLSHNFLFAQQKKNCVIVERQTVVNEFQANIDLMKDLNTIYIDGHFTVYPVSAGYGPYFLAYNNCFKCFTKEMHYKAPQRQYYSETYLKKSLRKYMKAYRNAYAYQWGMESWMLMYVDAIYEAYEDTEMVLNDYLSGDKPFMLKHYFNPYYWKRVVRRWIKKC